MYRHVMVPRTFKLSLELVFLDSLPPCHSVGHHSNLLGNPNPMDGVFSPNTECVTVLVLLGCNNLNFIAFSFSKAPLCIFLGLKKKNLRNLFCGHFPTALPASAGW